MPVEAATETVEVERLCDRWGRWLRSGEFSTGDGGFRYEPPDPTDGPGFSPGIHDPTSEIMDRLIARLGKPMRRAIVARYYWDMSNREAALQLCTNKTLYRMNVDFGLKWLDGHISGITGHPVRADDGLEGFAIMITMIGPVASRC